MSRRVSPLDNEQCRQCTSFADYIKQNREKIAEVNDDDEDMCRPEDAPAKPIRQDCPLDKDELGRQSWGLLHTMAAKYPQHPTEAQKRICHVFLRYFLSFILAKHVLLTYAKSMIFDVYFCVCYPFLL
ncbi:alr/erv [Holotrichia oblita]|uniref:Alr/erv n=1 Tax=Holotrichia oblita TaxID=644536 RepID=A0ACB9TYB5_HOLOL|nr:alr/erv [Holotrichia oblita]